MHIYIGALMIVLRTIYPNCNNIHIVTIVLFCGRKNSEHTTRVPMNYWLYSRPYTEKRFQVESPGLVCVFPVVHQRYYWLLLSKNELQVTELQYGEHNSFPTNKIILSKRDQGVRWWEREPARWPSAIYIYGYVMLYSFFSWSCWWYIEGQRGEKQRRRDGISHFRRDRDWRVYRELERTVASDSSEHHSSSWSVVRVMWLRSRDTIIPSGLHLIKKTKTCHLVVIFPDIKSTCLKTLQ